jgi:hypothetical protein
MTSDLENFLTDLVTLLRERAADAKDAAVNGDEMQKGRNFGLYEALSLIYQQAIAFGIEPERAGMSNFNPDRDLL